LSRCADCPTLAPGASAGVGRVEAAVEMILQKTHESFMLDLILERWDRRWIANALSIGKLD